MSKKDEYAKLLQDPRWTKRSKEIREWDCNVCQDCGESSKSAKMQVHHLYYDDKKMPWEYGNKALVTLCDDCHKKRHEFERDFYPKLKEKLNQLGENGCSKDVILLLLDMLIELTSDEKYYDLYNKLMYKLLNGLYVGSDLIYARKHKNDYFQTHRNLLKRKIKFAKEAHEWFGSTEPFNEDDYFYGDYSDEIKEYREYLKSIGFED